LDGCLLDGIFYEFTHCLNQDVPDLGICGIFPRLAAARGGFSKSEKKDNSI